MFLRSPKQLHNIYSEIALKNTKTKKMLRYFIAYLALLPLSTFAQSRGQQPHKCGFELAKEAAIQKHPELLKAYEQVDSLLSANASTTTQKSAMVLHTIPVVVHIIYADQSDNMSREQVLNALRVINEDYRRQNQDASNLRPIFQSVASDPEVEFKLATIDPKGNCTSGINRIQSNWSINANDNVKSLISWDNRKYLNIWVVRDIRLSGVSNVLGYAYFPVPNQSPTLDGIVIRHDQMGTIGTGTTDGRTLTHEVGHYLSLYHPFQGGCSGNGDFVSDTPPVFEELFGCPTGSNTCNNDSPDLPDMIENYMDYTDCQNTFTIGQKGRIKSVLADLQLRGDVSAPSNLSATGVVGLVCKPKAFFISDKRELCKGESVQFFERVIGGNFSSLNWQFPGGTPSNSNLENPSVVYNTPGVYSVSLTALNPNQNHDTTLSFYIKVKDGQAAQVPILSEDFETQSVPGNLWASESVNDYDAFNSVSGIGRLSNRSVVLNNYYATKGQTDFLYSPSLDLRFYTNVNLSFYTAFARTAATGNSDAMRLSISTDCGQNWSLIRLFNVVNLSGGKTQNTAFIPNAESDWIKSDINLNAYAGQSNPVQIRWEFISGNGNNIHLDDIMITGSLNTDLLQNESTVKAWPNPSQGHFVIQTNENLNSDLSKWKLFDARGRQVRFHIEESNQNEFELVMGTELPNGVYTLQIAHNTSVKNIRLVLMR